MDDTFTLSTHAIAIITFVALMAATVLGFMGLLAVRRCRRWGRERGVRRAPKADHNPDYSDDEDEVEDKIEHQNDYYREVSKPKL